MDNNKDNHGDNEKGRAYVIDRIKQAIVEGLIKRHISEYDPIDDGDSDDEGITSYRCFKYLIGTHENGDIKTKGHIFEIIETHKPKSTDKYPKTKEKLNSVIAEFKKFAYRIKIRYRCDVIEKALRKYESHKGKNEPLYSIQSTDGEEMELLKTDYYKRLKDGEATKASNIKDLATEKKRISHDTKGIQADGGRTETGTANHKPITRK